MRLEDSFLIFHNPLEIEKKFSFISLCISILIGIILTSWFLSKLLTFGRVTIIPSAFSIGETIPGFWFFIGEKESPFHSPKMTVYFLL